MTPEWVTVWLVAIGMLGAFCLWLMSSFARKDIIKVLTDNLAAVQVEISQNREKMIALESSVKTVSDAADRVSRTAESLGHVAASLDQAIKSLSPKKKKNLRIVGQ